MMDSKIIALIVIAAIGIGAVLFILPEDNNELTVIESEVVIEEPEVEEVVIEENGILSGEVEITIANLKFAPSEITIKKGTTVLWKQVDRSIGGSGGAVNWHNIVEGPPGKRGDHVFKSKELSFNGGFSYKFNEIGEFEYYCEPHPFMIGKIIVIE